ncbi:Uu.00g008920.m01.CDS01 [Anthostomella pinea]|uniref:Uu.00g008920.m01.CDS01 n=1 Tax=Anthostomella pinea TaxID=933095 RepID=A0AAI8VXA9_9PEZI|nr:Uu.00g008920.m01.CDS01 [Anthostomella pinea]
MAGATTEDVWIIIRYTWLKMLQKTARLGPGEWIKLNAFIELARDTVVRCDSILAEWNHRRERESCLKLYGALRGFPIAKWKTLDVSWQTQDGLMRFPMRN